jgi:hypothetical protein
MQKNKKINCGILLFIILYISLHCGNHAMESFFDRMPTTYNIDSLETYKDVFNKLVTRHGINNGISYLKVESDNRQLIPFCGYLHVFSDTVYYSSNKEEKGNPFLFLNAEKFKKWKINYSENRADSIIYVGKIYDKFMHDSLKLFWLKPQTTDLPLDASYLKFITLTDGGFRHFTFSNMMGDQTVILNSYPKIIYKTTGE